MSFLLVVSIAQILFYKWISNKYVCFRARIAQNRVTEIIFNRPSLVFQVALQPTESEPMFP